ncbi:peptidylprolyl isomerase [Cellulophaga sp. E16_2]|uniref:peptidylprolyl isomerase n=1 Tax=Cellulophaga sp. E16_2 TaxID=2789297 RepID=UPI001A92DB24|nr:peptidylprolyl isomerase [Cellulophaga sp. E16_2]MBO0593001.1 peptidylprolyl isomerase [Cellulophaga sp. E16_2]
MKLFSTFSSLLFACIFIYSCQEKQKDTETPSEKRQRIELVTNKGTMVIALYNDTPLHRDNFINLVQLKAYDSLLFHRVISNFMIQAGDPESRSAKANDTLGEGDVPYRVKAEILPHLFHKKGVLAAARDGNPERASSGMQFYIVQGKIYNDSLLTIAEKRINGWLAEHYIRTDRAHSYLLDSLQHHSASGNNTKYMLYKDSITNWAAHSEEFKAYTIPEDQRTVYKTLGGVPHLDQNYTVFGEVIEGLPIIDSIATTDIGEFDRPTEDVRIITMRLVE